MLRKINKCFNYSLKHLAFYSTLGSSSLQDLKRFVCTATLCIDEPLKAFSDVLKFKKISFSRLNQHCLIVEVNWTSCVSWSSRRCGRLCFGSEMPGIPVTKLREEHTALGFTTAPLKVYDVGFDLSPRRRI